MRILRKILIATLISLLMSGCGDAAEKKTTQHGMIKQTTATTKGARKGMKIYYIGRFAIDLPEEFKLEHRSQSIYYADVTDFKWNSRDHAKERETLWAEKIAEIRKLEKPRGRKQIVIEEKQINGIGNWAKAVEYYGDQYAPNCTYWTILADFGNYGLWLTLDGEDNKLSIKNFNNILSHYENGFDNLTKNSFCLNYGRLELPYEEQERTYIRFAGPMDIKLEIETKETFKVEKAGLLDRVTAALATNFAPGVDVDKIRTGKRKVADMPGQEVIMRGTDNMGTDLFFAWDYQGKEDSGEYPEIKIMIEESEDEKLDEKKKIWDGALDSFRRAYNQR